MSDGTPCVVTQHVEPSLAAGTWVLNMKLMSDEHLQDLGPISRIIGHVSHVYYILWRKNALKLLNQLSPWVMDGFAIRLTSQH